MQRLSIAFVLGIGIFSLAAPFTSTSSFALCNKICQAKCTLSWQHEFKSEAECRAVWSRRNGPSGLGCGGKGAPFQRCE